MLVIVVVEVVVVVVAIVVGTVGKEKPKPPIVVIINILFPPIVAVADVPASVPLGPTTTMPPPRRENLM